MYNLTVLKKYPAHTKPLNGSPCGSVNYISISPYNDYFATCSDDRTIKIWALDNYKGKKLGDLICTLPEQEHIINIVTFSEDCKFLATANWAGIIKVYKTKNNWKSYEEIFNRRVFFEDNKKYPIKELYFNIKGDKDYLLFKVVNQQIKAFKTNDNWKNVKEIDNDQINKLRSCFVKKRKICQLVIVSNYEEETCIRAI